MIDMTFQLIAFFMVLIRFAEAEVSEKVQLPISELAKPPQKAPENFITVQITADQSAIIRGNEVPLPSVPGLLAREVEYLEGLPTRPSPSETTVLIRAHKDALTGDVQQVISDCQKARFEKFSLRAEYDAGY